MRSEYFESANSFTYNGINSLDMGLFITGRVPPIQQQSRRLKP